TGRAWVGSPERPEIRNRRRVCAGTADEHEIVSVEEEPKLWELGEKDVGRGADDAALQSRMFDQFEGGCSRPGPIACVRRDLVNLNVFGADLLEQCSDVLADREGVKSER